MTTTTMTGTVPHRNTLKIRLFAVHNAVLAAIVAWVVEVHLLGISLVTQFGSSAPRTLPLVQIIAVSGAVSLAGWAVLSFIERRSGRAAVSWTVLAVAVVFASLALPIAAAVSVASMVALIVMHIAVAASYVPFMYRSALRAE
ncbi:MAG: DUF6069 family protein [Acidimicrobiales bacterium]